jgi:hypothetical protein
MKCLRKYLQRVGLVSTLLIGGVVGGLMAPLPSEAQTRPTVTLKVDSGDARSILTATGTCPLETGYTACYTIDTTLTVVGVPPPGTTLPARSYWVRNAPGATARLRVADLAGPDKLSLVGVQFVPTPLTGQTVANWNTATNTTANTSETHVLTLTLSHSFDSATTNIANAGNYVWAIRAGGEFRAGPTAAGACAGAACNTIGNSVTFPGTGTFSPTLENRNILSPSGKNSQTLSFTVAGPTNPIVSFNGLTNATLGQENPTYPTFLCDSDGSGAGTACKPSITEVMTVTLKGPDSFVLVNGGDGFGAPCAATLTATQQKQIALLTKLVAFLKLWESGHHSLHLEAFIAKIDAFLATVNTVDQNCGGATLVNLEIAIAAAIDQVAFAASGAVPAEPVTTGTITIVKNLNTSCEIECGNHTFNFRITNQATEVETTHSIVTSSTGSTVVMVPIGTYNVVESPQSGWTLTASSCNGGNTNGFTVSAGSNVTCNFTNSPATSNDLGIRLTWGTTPLDLDSHLYVPNGYHVFFSNQGSLVSSPYADLDLDDTTSFGPENITVVKRMKGTYQYFVHNWSQTFTPGMTSSPAKVELIRNGVTTTYFPPAGEGSNLYWHVFNIRVDDDTCSVQIVAVNAWLASPPTPITRSEVLCP